MLPPPDLATVQHEVVGLGADPPGLTFEKTKVGLVW